MDQNIKGHLAKALMLYPHMVSPDQCCVLLSLSFFFFWKENLLSTVTNMEKKFCRMQRDWDSNKSFGISISINIHTYICIYIFVQEDTNVYTYVCLCVYV